MKNNSLEKIKKYLQLSSYVSLVLGIIFFLFLICSIFIYIFYDNFVEAIKNSVSLDFGNLLQSIGKINLIYLYILVLLLIIPFFLDAILQTVRSSKLSRNLVKMDNNSFISIMKDSFVYTGFGVAFIVAIIIVFVFFKIGNFWFIFIPLILVVPLYAIGSFYKIKAFKLAEELRKTI